MFGRKSCLKRMILEWSGTLSKPQNLRKVSGIVGKSQEKGVCRNRKDAQDDEVHKKTYKGYLRDLPVDA